MTKAEIREKCKYFGLAYLGEWDEKHWALKEKVQGLAYHGGMPYELQDEFLKAPQTPIRLDDE